MFMNHPDASTQPLMNASLISMSDGTIVVMKSDINCDIVSLFIAVVTVIHRDVEL